MFKKRDFSSLVSVSVWADTTGTTESIYMVMTALTKKIFIATILIINSKISGKSNNILQLDMKC